MREGGGKRGWRGWADQMSAPEDENELDWQQNYMLTKNMLYGGSGR